MPNIPEKRTNPFEKTLNQMREEQNKKTEAVKEEKTATAKKAAPKTGEKKVATKAAAKPTAKKATTKKTPAKKAVAKKPAKVKIDSKTGIAKVVAPKPKTTKKVEPAKEEKAVSTKKVAATPKAVSKKTATRKAPVKKAPEVLKTPVPEVIEKVEDITPIPVETVPTAEVAPTVVESVEEVAPAIDQTVPVKKPRKISKRAQLLKEQKAAERAAAKAAKLVPVVVVRPTPKKFKLTTKEDKAQYKKLEESFDYLVNLASVVEEKTMNKEEINDITLGELHVIQMVNKYNNKPMTLIANKLKVTVGSLITCLNRLIQKDYIVRTRDEMDNRVILLTVTQKAKKVLKAHDKFHEDILGLLLENGVTLQQATKVLSTLVTTLEVYYDPIHNSFETKEKGSKAKKK